MKNHTTTRLWSQYLSVDPPLPYQHQNAKNKQVVISLETMCLNILTVRQQREVSVNIMLIHELCSHPPNIIDKYGNLRKDN